VLTYHNDNARTGQNLNEAILKPSNVNATTFGKLFTASVDGKVDAQPLYMSNIAIPGQGTHNVLLLLLNMTASTPWMPILVQRCKSPAKVPRKPPTTVTVVR
jgi:hypothetical protein